MVHLKFVDLTLILDLLGLAAFLDLLEGVPAAVSIFQKTGTFTCISDTRPLIVTPSNSSAENSSARHCKMSAVDVTIQCYSPEWPLNVPGGKLVESSLKALQGGGAKASNIGFRTAHSLYGLSVS